MNIRNGSIAVAAALAFGSISTGALAAGTISTTAPASVTVLSPVTITKTQDLVFGSVVRPSTGTTTTTLDTSGGISQTQAGGGDGSIVGSVTSAAKFNVVGPAAQVYTTGQTLTFTQAGLTGITPSLPAATTGTLGTLPASGIQELRYGGSFTMSSATTAQNYTGTLTVTINYN